MLHRLIRVGEGQEIVEVLAFEAAPARMLRDECWGEAIDGASDPREVRSVERIVGTESQPDTVQAQWVGLPRAFQRAHVRAAIVKVVLGVNFDPAHPRLLTQHRLMVRGAQPDPGTSQDRAARFRLAA